MRATLSESAQPVGTVGVTLSLKQHRDKLTQWAFLRNFRHQLPSIAPAATGRSPRGGEARFRRPNPLQGKSEGFISIGSAAAFHAMTSARRL